MNNKASVVIIMAAVSALLFFVVSAVRDFNEASVIRSSGKISAKDSLVSARLDSLQVRDSVLTELVMQQEQTISRLREDIRIVRHNLTVIGNALSE